MRYGWDFFAKTQLLGVFNHFCDSASFRQLPPASVAYSLVDFASTWDHPFGGGELFVEVWVVFCAKTQFLGVFNHFCDSVSFRHLP